MIILKVNNNRDYESVKAEGYFDAQYKVGDKCEYPEAECCCMNMGTSLLPRFRR